MIQGTSSHAGKSVLVAGILRILRNRGYSCAPFKPQNMALNSFVTPDGFEIGRAQAMQAEAAKVLPSYLMNPILLKPTTDSKAQIVVCGKPWKNLSALEYQRFKGRLKKIVKECFEALKREYDIVIVEGAGSPAEINLRKNDIANMGFATLYGIPVLIVGDIDRGGIYASFYGTYSLLTKKERSLVKGFIINKFRGTKSLLEPANKFIEKRTKIPVLGVIPYFNDIKLNDEDGVSLSYLAKKGNGSVKTIKIKVIKLPRISNFTDFEPLILEEDVDLEYVTSSQQCQDGDMIIIPGSKNTIEDLLFLEKSGFKSFLKRFLKQGGYLCGICGGYQMLGKVVKDPYSIESPIKELKGLGIFDAETVLEREKKLKQVKFNTIDNSLQDMEGYEIHMGKTTVYNGVPLFVVKDGMESRFEGVTILNGRVFGTYIHGLFDNDNFRLNLLNRLREKKGMPIKKRTFSYRIYKDRAYDRLASYIEESLDMDYIFSLLGI